LDETLSAVRPHLAVDGGDVEIVNVSKYIVGIQRLD